jgi:hypothetical protein
VLGLAGAWVASLTIGGEVKGTLVASERLEAALKVEGIEGGAGAPSVGTRPGARAWRAPVPLG